MLLCMEEVLFKERPALMDPPALAHGIPPSSSLKRAKSALLRSRVLILLVALLPPCRILNGLRMEGFCFAVETRWQVLKKSASPCPEAPLISGTLAAGEYPSPGAGKDCI